MDRVVLSSLLRINRHHRRTLKCALAPYQYVGVMHLIVIYVSRSPGTSQEEIAGYFALDKTSVARDARRLEEFQKNLSAGISPEDWGRLALLLKRLEENACQI